MNTAIDYMLTDLDAAANTVEGRTGFTLGYVAARALTLRDVAEDVETIKALEAVAAGADEVERTGDVPAAIEWVATQLATLEAL